MQPISGPDPGSVAGAILAIFHALRVGAERVIPRRMMEVRATRTIQSEAGSYSIELDVLNRRADAAYRVQVIECIGMNKAQRSAPWYPQWQHAERGEVDHQILRGGSGLIWLVVTRSRRDGTDEVPRFLEFPTAEHYMHRSWVEHLPGDQVANAAAAEFIDRRVRLRLRIWNRRLSRSQLWELAFWVTHELEVEREFTRVKRRGILRRRPERLDPGVP